MNTNNNKKIKVIVVGSGNAALCAGISALESGATVLMLEKGNEELAGGNTKYTAGAMRFFYNSKDDLLPLMSQDSLADPRLENSDFGSYGKDKFKADLLKFNDGRPLSQEQHYLVDESYLTLKWLANLGVKFEPIYNRQSTLKDDKYIFWGGLTLATNNEGVGLFDQELATFQKLGGQIKYQSSVVDLIEKDGKIQGVVAEILEENGNIQQEKIYSNAVILGSGGFEANSKMRMKYLGEEWEKVKVRGTPHNTGDGIQLALKYGAKKYGNFKKCHATPMDILTADFGGLHLDPKERKNFRKICYFLGVMLNKNGKRFVDEGIDFRNYTYAQFGNKILQQPRHLAYQIFDSKVFEHLYEEYHFSEAHFFESENLEGLMNQIDDIDKNQALQTLNDFNQAVDKQTPFNASIKDGKSTQNLELAKSNWAQKIDTPPYRAYPVTCGITFTYGGLKLSTNGQVISESGDPIPGLYACGELVGGVFFNGYPGGSGLTSGAVFGRLAGQGIFKQPKF